MDYRSLVDTFWGNVTRIKEDEGLKWSDISEKSGHSVASVSSMKNSKKMPSLGFARSIAAALGTTTDRLCMTDDELKSLHSSSSLVDVLAKAAEGLPDAYLLMLISSAENMKEIMESGDIQIGQYTSEHEGSIRGRSMKTTERIAELKEKYLSYGPSDKDMKDE